jgi:hypothetical protein
VPFAHEKQILPRSYNRSMGFAHLVLRQSLVLHMLRQCDADVFKRYSQAKFNMMREALGKLDRHANEHHKTFGTPRPN